MVSWRRSLVAATHHFHLYSTVRKLVSLPHLTARELRGVVFIFWEVLYSVKNSTITTMVGVDSVSVKEELTYLRRRWQSLPLLHFLKGWNWNTGSVWENICFWICLVRNRAVGYRLTGCGRQNAKKPQISDPLLYTPYVNPSHGRDLWIWWTLSRENLKWHEEGASETVGSQWGNGWWERGGSGQHGKALVSTAHKVFRWRGTGLQCPWHCGWDETRSHRLLSPVEEKGWHGHSLKRRARLPLPWQAFIVFLGTLHWGWSSFTMHRFTLGGYILQKTKERMLLITSKRRNICKCKRKSGWTGYTCPWKA